MANPQFKDTVLFQQRKKRKEGNHNQQTGAKLIAQTEDKGKLEKEGNNKTKKHKQTT